MRGVDPRRLVFVDECGTHTSMTRRKARAPRGSRARGSVPRNRGPVTTLIAGVSLAGMSPAMTVEGGTDTAVFATYLEHFLLPSLAPGMLVVVDNVGAHQPDRIRQLVAAAGNGVSQRFSGALGSGVAGVGEPAGGVGRGDRGQRDGDGGVQCRPGARRGRPNEGLELAERFLDRGQVRRVGG